MFEMYYVIKKIKQEHHNRLELIYYKRIMLKRESKIAFFSTQRTRLKTKFAALENKIFSLDNKIRYVKIS